ncbi:MAG: DUF177 domain-containing protein [Rhodospirillales bacterium]|nr:DUF177 domain-containing protein [Rhodospirillales bacterium]
MNNTPELHRPFVVDELPNKGKVIKIDASAEEMQAIAKRLGLIALNVFKGELLLKPEIGRQVSLTGPIRAEIVQNCVISGVALSTTLDFELDRLFAEDADPFAGLMDDDDDGITDPEIDEPDPIIEGIIDVGDQAVEELALNIPPYPRAPGASFDDLAPALAVDSAEVHPFSALSALKDRIKSKD